MGQSSTALIYHSSGGLAVEVLSCLEGQAVCACVSVLWNANEAGVLPLQDHQQVTDVSLMPSDRAGSRPSSRVLDLL